MIAALIDVAAAAPLGFALGFGLGFVVGARYRIVKRNGGENGG